MVATTHADAVATAAALNDKMMNFYPFQFDQKESKLYAEFIRYHLQRDSHRSQRYRKVQ